MFRVDLQPGQTIALPDGAGPVTFHGVKHWTRLQISRTPDVWLTLLGVVLALVGLLGSLFIRPRRVWVRARRQRRYDAGRGGRTGPVRGRRPDRRTLVGGGLVAGRPRSRGGATGVHGGGTRMSDLAVGAPQQPGDRGRRGRLLPGAAGAPGRVERAAYRAGEAATPKPRSRRRGHRWLDGRRRRRRRHVTTDAPDEAKRYRIDDVRPAGAAAHGHRRARRTSSACSAAAWPPTRTGCPGATCTSSRSPARSSSCSATCCCASATAWPGWARSSPPWSSCC